MLYHKQAMNSQYHRKEERKNVWHFKTLQHPSTIAISIEVIHKKMVAIKEAKNFATVSKLFS